MDCVNVTSTEQGSSDFVEVDPTGRYGRVNTNYPCFLVFMYLYLIMVFKFHLFFWAV